MLQYTILSLALTIMSKRQSKSSTKPTPPTPPANDVIVIARPMVRLATILYDGMLILALLFLVGTALAVVGTLVLLDVGTQAQQAQQLPKWYQHGVMTPAFILTLVGFYGLFWRKSGQTLGMQTWRLKTVTINGQLLTWQQSFWRILCACLIPMLCALIGGLFYQSRSSVLMCACVGFLFNYLFCWVNTQGLAIHDILSKTTTVKIPKYEHTSIFTRFKKSP